MTFRSDPRPADFKPLYHARGRLNAALRRVRAQSVGYLRPGFPDVLEDLSVLFPSAEIVDLAAARAQRGGPLEPVHQKALTAEPAASTSQMVGLLTRLLLSLKR